MANGTTAGALGYRLYLIVSLEPVRVVLDTCVPLLTGKEKHPSIATKLTLYDACPYAGGNVVALEDTAYSDPM